VALAIQLKLRYDISVAGRQVQDRREEHLRKYFLQRRILEIRVAGRRQSSLRIKLTGHEVSPPVLADFSNVPTLFGPQVIGTRQYPKRFDLVARPTHPKRAEAIIVELKAGKLCYQDLRQLLGYITFVRYIQIHGGPTGLRLLSEAFRFRITRRMRVSGLLVGRALSTRLMQWIPEEVWDLVRICTFRVTEGKWPNDYRKIQIYDRGDQFKRERRRQGKLLRDALNPS
jgi:hypothetical protein